MNDTSLWNMTTNNNKLCAPNIIVYTASYVAREPQLLLRKRYADYGSYGSDTIYTVFSPNRGVYD